ncbi:MAG: 2-amino-4-hydroxy-6-hydroxymethyldihydropteridine diphosphokinase [Flavobacteriales bacterium]|nr:MAG: 2-amino-4-hydroxy-6-hydroxymethyldihydropteridine diphosphokinase [Flavobacteriales bacterium]
MVERLKGEIILALGSNLGNREENLSNSISLIGKKIGEVTKISKYFENDPVGFDSKNKFINLCIKVETTKKPLEILKELKSIEKSLGRIWTNKEYEDRPLDIDIILFNDFIMTSEDLIIPHPRYTSRPFVLVPMCGIGDYIDPKVFLTCKQLLK